MPAKKETETEKVLKDLGKAVAGPDPIEDAEKVVKVVDKTVNKTARRVFRKYPITFTLLSIFGFASVMHGVEGLIENHPYFGEHPGVVLLIGLALLLITGTLYKWLQNREIRM